MSKLCIDSFDSNSAFIIRDYLYKELESVTQKNRPIVFICIGTDRSTGDSLGPLIGSKLRPYCRDRIVLYGDLEHPVHAKNLNSILDDINSKYKHPYIVAIDACLGSLDHVGNIIIEKKPVLPGIAVNKQLPPVGDLSILGVVNIGGNLEFMVLQNTRLYTVMSLANTISRGIHHYMLKSFGSKRKNISIDSLLEKIL